MKNRSFKSNDEYEEKLRFILDESGLTFSEFVRKSIDNHVSSNINSGVVSNNIAKKQHLVRLYENDEKMLSEIANKKGVTVPKEIRFRISSTLGTNLFDFNEALTLKDCANEVAKVGRLLNQAIKQRLLVGTKHTDELSSKIDALKNALISLSDKAMKRVK